jgi:hypothetical protein
VLEGILVGIIDASLLRKAMQSCSGVDKPERIAIEDRSRGFACMAAAAGQGVAPRV